MNTHNEIEIVQNKTLKLNNVLTREFNGTADTDLERMGHMFESYMRSHKMEPYGPMVIRSRTSYVNGKPEQRSAMCTQLRQEPGKVDPPYCYEGSLRIENCLMARYRGNISQVMVAYSKMQVYCFENDIHLKDEIYTVFVEMKDGYVLADIFAEILP